MIMPSPSTAPLRTWRRPLLAAGLCLPLLAGTLPQAWADQVVKLTPDQRAGLPMETTKVTASERVPVTQGLARIRPASSDQASHRVMAPLSGQVVGDLPAQGDSVKAGQVLVRISSDQLAGYLGQWQSAAADALAARQALARDKALFADGLIPRKRLETSQANASMAQAHLAATRARLATAGIDDPDKLQSESMGKAHGAEIAIKAPIAGVITSRSVMPGDRVSQGAAMFEITSATSQWWLMSVSPDVLPPTGTPLWMNVDGCDQSAKVRLMDLAVNPASQLITLRAHPDQACARLRPGQYVDATLMKGVEQPVAVVPQVAVTRLGKQDQVYVVRGGEIRAVSVRILGRGNGQVYVQAVTAGALREGDSVVTQGVSRLKGIELGMGSE